MCGICLHMVFTIIIQCMHVYTHNILLNNKCCIFAVELINNVIISQGKMSIVFASYYFMSVYTYSYMYIHMYKNICM